MLLIDCRQDRESENIVNRLSLEVLMYSKSSWIALASSVKIVDSLGKHAEKISFLITAAAATLFLSFEPSV
jgi:hypothetical protein